MWRASVSTSEQTAKKNRNRTAESLCSKPHRGSLPLKPETRRPKSEAGTLRLSGTRLGLSDFGLQNSFGLRIADFGFPLAQRLKPCRERPDTPKSTAVVKDSNAP